MLHLCGGEGLAGMALRNFAVLGLVYLDSMCTAYSADMDCLPYQKSSSNKHVICVQFNQVPIDRLIICATIVCKPSHGALSAEDFTKIEVSHVRSRTGHFNIASIATNSCSCMAEFDMW